jgi:hypothetical protein
MKKMQRYTDMVMAGRAKEMRNVLCGMVNKRMQEVYHFGSKRIFFKKKH